MPVLYFIGFILFNLSLASLLLHNLLKEEDKTLIDIGTGAGFPGMMLAIFNEDKKFILLDSVRKKTDFLELVKKWIEFKKCWNL